jgi:hypothetical protein
MPTRKQRRRRAKEKRHEWEYVEIDPETGEEHVLESGEEEPARSEARAPSRRTAQASSRRPARTVHPPSWGKVAKRGLIFAPLMFLTVSILDSRLSVAARLIQTILLLAFFIPFSYAMDSLAYRTFLKRGGVPAPPKQAKAKKT